MYRASAYQPREPRQRLILIGAIVVRGEHHQAPPAFLFGTDKADDAVDSEGKAPLIEMLTPACGSSWAQTAFTALGSPVQRRVQVFAPHRLYGYLARIALAVVKLDDLGSPGPPPSRWSRRARFWERAVKPLATRPEIEIPRGMFNQQHAGRAADAGQAAGKTAAWRRDLPATRIAFS